MTPRSIPKGPYAAAAEQYLETGWAPIPLPPRKKMPPPKGWTGGSRSHSGEMPSVEQVGSWIASQGNGNIAIRLMDGYIAVDVDSYDGKQGESTLSKAELKWGPLPRTVMSSARSDGSGCRIFRVPKGLKWPGNLNNLVGNGIDLCRWDLRFVIVAPSIHPKTGDAYQWRDSLTFEPLEDDFELPELEHVADLPAGWVEGLTEGKPWVGFSSVDLGPDEANQWLDERNGPDVCSLMDSVLTKFQGKIMVAADEGGIYDLARGGAWALLREAAKGHSGIKPALARLKKTYGVAMEERTPERSSSADGDWKRFIFDGVQKLSAEGGFSERDDCASQAAAAKEIGESGGKIVLGNTPDSIRELGKALCARAIPETYARRGEFVRLRQAVNEDGEVRLIAEPLTADSLRQELAVHCKVVAPKFTKEGELDSYVDKSPPVDVLKSVLTVRDWKQLPVLRGLVGQPVFRPDGSLLQTAGYDSMTGIYYAPERDHLPVPAEVDPIEVSANRLWLMDEVLCDFPWVAPADFANYLALLITPLLRPVMGEALAPFGVVTATAPGSGKSLLAEDIPTRLYRLTSYPWTRREEERQKSITTAFSADSQVVVFDNVGDNDRIDSPSLAKLLTSRAWDDRRMGKNTEVLSYVNNRLWMATGNNISLGGDMRSRSVLVRLDPVSESPEFRTGFRMGDLNVWLEDSGNCDRLLRALLILCVDWIAAGAPREERVMRGFSQWASCVGGFLKHHGISGFLDNADALREADSEEEEWGAFLADLRRESNGKALTASEIHALYVDGFGRESGSRVPLPARADGGTPSVRGLGMMLQKRKGRFFTGMCLAGCKDATNVWRWTVHTMEELKAAKEGAKTGNSQDRPGLARD